MTFTDTHTHLFAEEFDADLDEVINRAIEKNVTRFFLPNIDSTTIDKMLNLAKKFPDNCFPMLGLHPCSVSENFDNELKIVEEFLSKQKFYAIGEMGLDFYWDLTFAEQQKIVFRKQVKLALKNNLPVVIHSRTDLKKTNENAFEECISILNEFKNENLKGIFHCFTGNSEDAQKVIRLGFYLGIGGSITLKNSELPKVIEQIDLKHIVLETDSPYITPVPFRGKRNESSYLIHIAQKISEIKKVSIEEVAEITTGNSKTIFEI